MRITEFVFLTLVVTLGPWTLAEALGDEISVQLKGCTRACLTESEKCLSLPSVSASFCDTHEISCASSCETCIKSFATCMNVSDRAVSYCQNVFAACVDEKLSANRGREHIPVLFKGGDGSTRETAVVIEGVMSDAETVLAENLWAFRNHAAWQKGDQTRLAAEHRAFDKVEYQSPEGPHTVWFDITAGSGN